MEKPIEAQKSVKTSPNADYLGLAFRIVGDFGVTIAVPAVVATFLGVWLDQRLGTVPWLLMICIGAALLFTMYLVNKKAHRYADLFDRIGAKEKEK